MNISYRTRRFLRRLCATVLWLVLIGVLFWGCWVIWLQRYVVYTRDEGVKLDWSRSSADISGEVAVPPPAKTPVSIHFVEDEDVVDVSNELTQILGFHVTTDALLHDINTVKQQIEMLTPGSAVMVDVKSIYGNFYYNTKIPNAPVTDSLNPATLDQLITMLKENDFYAIARVPALRDRHFGIENTHAGLASSGGIGLWEDEAGCYWLDPTEEDTIAYLVQIINELRSLGFDEVVFYEFEIPDSDGGIDFEFEQTKEEAIAQAATQLVSTCTTGSFAVSFQADSSFVLPEGRTRLYIEGVEANQAASVAAGIPVTDPAINLVFLATSNDTRYNAYSALRNLDVGQNGTEE